MCFKVKKKKRGGGWCFDFSRHKLLAVKLMKV